MNDNVGNRGHTQHGCGKISREFLGRPGESSKHTPVQTLLVRDVLGHFSTKYKDLLKFRHVSPILWCKTGILSCLTSHAGQQ